MVETPWEKGVGCGGDSLGKGGRVWWRLLYHLNSSPILRFHLHLDSHRNSKKLLQLIIMIMINDCGYMYFIYLNCDLINEDESDHCSNKHYSSTGENKA